MSDVLFNTGKYTLKPADARNSRKSPESSLLTRELSPKQTALRIASAVTLLIGDSPNKEPTPFANIFSGKMWLRILSSPLDSAKIAQWLPTTRPAVVS